jgi:hypothetical protein
VWLNPPYNNLCRKFVAKLEQEYAEGHVTEAIVLPNLNSMSTKWFQGLLRYPVLVYQGRTRFIPGDPDVKQTIPTNGSAFVHMGRNEKRFRKVFGEFGTILES